MKNSIDSITLLITIMMIAIIGVIFVLIAFPGAPVTDSGSGIPGTITTVGAINPFVNSLSGNNPDAGVPPEMPASPG